MFRDPVPPFVKQKSDLIIFKVPCTFEVYKNAGGNWTCRVFYLDDQTQLDE